MSEEIVRHREAEARALGRLMGENYRAGLEHYTNLHKRYGKKTWHEAAEMAQKDVDAQRNPEEAHMKGILRKPLDALDYCDLEALEKFEKGKGWEKWDQMHRQAEEDLDCGVYGAEAVVSRHAPPMRRAQYVALRNKFMQQWQPRDMIEETLIEQLTQQYTLYLHWMQVSSAHGYGEMRQLSDFERVYDAPKVSEQEADAHALTMTERFHRMFLRTLRALRDMRRFAPVIIQNAGQVNVGAQQVNVAQPPNGDLPASL